MKALGEYASASVVVGAICVLAVVAAVWLFVLDHAREVLLLVAVLCVFAVAGCHLVTPPPPVPHVGGTAEDCGPACDNLARLGCPGHEGSPGMDGMYGTVDDVSCERACRDIVGAEPGVTTLYQKCVIGAQTCDAADRCLAEGP